MASPLNLLIAEDNPDDADLLIWALRGAGFEFEYHVVSKEEDFLRWLSPSLDLIISDYEMPGFGGMRALELKQLAEIDVPFIIISGSIGEEMAVEAMRRGATDYLLKGCLSRLESAVTQAISQRRLRHEQLKTVAQLRESEERFREVVQNIEQVFWMTNVEKTEMLFVSDAYEKIWGHTCESLYASPKQWLEAIHPEDRERVLAAALTRQVDGSYQEEYRIVRPDGAVRWISDRAFPVRDADGNVYRVAGISEDVTERRQAQFDLQLFRKLVDASNDTFEVIDPESGRFLDVSAKGPAESGFTREEYLKMRVFDINPDIPPSVWSRYMEQMQAGEAVTGEARHYCKDGTAYPIEFNGKLVQLEKPYVVAVIRDISTRKLSEERMREQAAMLNLAHDAIFVHGYYDGLITFWNKGAENLYGWSADETLGNHFREFIDIDSAQLEQRNAELLIKDEWHGEIIQTDRQGKKVIVNSRATLVRDERGKPKSVFLIHADMTEQRELEARFLRAQRMESIGTLASGVAHDLNNILSPIMMSVPLLRRNLEKETFENVISTIELSATRGAEIVKQVLTFGRGLDGVRRPTSLASIIQEIIKILGQTFPKDIRIETELAPDLWRVVGDSTQLHQVMLNLCVNARDAMPTGGKLRIRGKNAMVDSSYAGMLPGATAGPNVILEVQDEGTGIPPEIVERIFDPFFTTKGLGKGTGLGLSTVLGIIKSHHGHVGVSSQTGFGTTFRIHLPAMGQESEDARASQPLNGLPRGNGECLLVVDDEEHVRRLVQLSLEASGYTVLVATDGTEALTTFAQNVGRIDLVITDLMMPYMGGVALIHALRKIRPGIPIVGSTGLAEKRQLAELEQMNIQALLNKPYGSDTLLQTVREALATRGGNGHVAANDLSAALAGG
ncbi:multi-sensor hybrid histidine kinase [Chthoniobacter flavus Ellin428]|uniref:histidine kinase n=1 Tax=Chthoniobacter flavus Ellin428 TaxID=497964 RepID=B4D8T1_9BACT|nr:PAS domain S-box protein [Chthoniobacter flavus]EDY17139.1 multi-sensor hybrid histidine kinase [Chthoniobacter flavus Ellin428]TCO90201.1 PAS domain S-box-containing protein [Chthoniobacter flavus]